MPVAPKEMLEAINTCLKLDEDFALSEWEENFVINIERSLSQGRPLSQKQITALERIYDRT